MDKILTNKEFVKLLKDESEKYKNTDMHLLSMFLDSADRIEKLELENLELKEQTEKRILYTVRRWLNGKT
jgi:hypothetical protein